MLPHTSTKLLQDLLEPANNDAWQRFEQAYWPILVGFARRLGLGDHDAADAAQETLIEFVQKHRAGQFDRRRGRLRSWLFGIAERKVREQVRRKGRRHEVRGQSAIIDQPGDDALNQAWEQECRSEMLRQALRELRETSRLSRLTILAFELFCLRGVSPEEVAAELEITVDAVYKAKHRCVRRLARILGELKTTYGE